MLFHMVAWAREVEMLESMVSSQIRRKLDFQERLARSRELEASQKEELARKTFSLHDADEATEGSDAWSKAIFDGFRKEAIHELAWL